MIKYLRWPPKFRNKTRYPLSGLQSVALTVWPVQGQGAQTEKDKKPSASQTTKLSRKSKEIYRKVQGARELSNMAVYKVIIQVNFISIHAMNRWKMKF